MQILFLEVRIGESLVYKVFAYKMYLVRMTTERIHYIHIALIQIAAVGVGYMQFVISFRVELYIGMG